MEQAPLLQNNIKPGPMPKPVKNLLTAGGVIGMSVLFGIIFTIGQSYICINITYSGCGEGFLVGILIWPIIGTLANLLLFGLLRGFVTLVRGKASYRILFGVMLLVNLLLLIGTGWNEQNNADAKREQNRPFEEKRAQQQQDLRLEQTAATIQDCDGIRVYQFSWNVCVDRTVKNEVDYQECLRQANTKTFDDAVKSNQEVCENQNPNRL